MPPLIEQVAEGAYRHIPRARHSPRKNKKRAA